MQMNVNNVPLVSVIVPCYNSSKYLKTCLDSLQKQTYNNIEVIIIDDGSMDDSLMIARKIVDGDSRFKLLINDRNMGVAYTRSRGIRKASGIFVALMDSDDYSLHDRLKLQVEALLKYPNVDVVGGSCICYNTKDGREEIINYPNDHADLCLALLMDMPFCNSSLMFRSKCFNSLTELYDESFAPAEDFALLVRLKLKNRTFLNLNDILVRRNIHEDSITFTKQKNLFQARLQIIGMQLPEDAGFENLRRFVYHFCYGGDKITAELGKEWILKQDTFLSLMHNLNLLNMYGDNNWKKFVRDVNDFMIKQTIKKFGIWYCLVFSLKNGLFVNFNHYLIKRF
jgi:glycosyltransferase involved in cell wall biosynthesis